MGCDIHLYVEVKKDNKWEYYDWEFQNGTYNDGSPRYDYNKIVSHPLHVGRNYNLFAILANVRNGEGFAGTGFKSISLPTVKFVSNTEMDLLLKNKLIDKSNYFTKLQWEETYKEAVGKHWFKTLDYLLTLGEVRIVFWFDN